MPRIRRAIVLLAAFATVPAHGAEPIVVELWPGKVPGDVGIKGEERSRIHNSPLVGPTKLITNVSKPTLTVYLPPKGHNTGTAMIVCPGGGYWDLYWELEGEEVAAWLNTRGMAAILLKYRCPRRPGEPERDPPLGPQLDAQRAVRIVRSRAHEWGIDPKRVGIVGFSAGGHLAIATATNFPKRLYEPVDAADALSSRPDFAVLCYPGYLKDRDRDAINPTITIPPTRPPSSSPTPPTTGSATAARSPSTAPSCTSPSDVPASPPSCPSSPPATTTSASGRTRSCRRAGRGSA